VLSTVAMSDFGSLHSARFQVVDPGLYGLPVFLLSQGTQGLYVRLIVHQHVDTVRVGVNYQDITLIGVQRR
jgi:hypothetical protein